MAAAGRTRRKISPGAYLIFLLLFGLIVFSSHAGFLRLPYFWDEAGQFIPAAVDILRDGTWIPHSTVPNIHPPAVMAYLAAWWKVAGYNPLITRCAMLVLSSFALLAAFLLAIELLRDVRGAPAFLAVGFLAVSPLFVAQAMLAQLDLPAMLFTVLALLFFLQERFRLAAAACVVLVLVKETGAVVPLVFGLRLAYERRWAEASLFAAPAVVLGAWILALYRATGHWMGNADFAQYNLYYPLHPVRLTVTLFRRVYYLAGANLHWIGTIAVVYAWSKCAMFRSRPWKIAGLLLAAHVVMFTLLGGAVLERYLLPVMPITYAAMAAALMYFPPRARFVSTLVLIAGLGAANFLNPPYPFPYEDNLAFTHFVKLQRSAADYLERWYPGARVTTAWPFSAALTRPDLGYVQRGFAVELIPDISVDALDRVDWARVEVLVTYSRSWNPDLIPPSLRAMRSVWRKYLGFVPNATQAEARARIPIPPEVHFESAGQWLDVYVSPNLRRRF